MGEYAPIFAPGASISYATSAAVVGGQLLYVSGNGTVAKTAAAVPNWVGVAANDAGSGDRVTIRTGGVQKLVCAGDITAGAEVVSAANGAVAALAAASGNAAADINAARSVVGIALTTALDTATVEVQMNR